MLRRIKNFAVPKVVLIVLLACSFIFSVLGVFAANFDNFDVAAWSLSSGTVTLCLFVIFYLWNVICRRL